MNVMPAVQAAAFEAANESDLYHYPSVFARPMAPELARLVALAKSVFSTAFQHPDFGVESTVAKDRFLVFEHDGEVAVLVQKSGETQLFMPEQPQQKREAWLWVFVKQYLREFNPDNLSHIPFVPVAPKAKPARRAIARAAKQAKAPKVAKVSKAVKAPKAPKVPKPARKSASAVDKATKDLT